MKFLRSAGKSLYRGWMAFARVLGIINTTIILVLVYILIIGPLWLVMTVARRDLLGRRLHGGPSFWKTKEQRDDTLEGARRQF